MEKLSHSRNLYSSTIININICPLINVCAAINLHLLKKKKLWKTPWWKSVCRGAVRWTAWQGGGCPQSCAAASSFPPGAPSPPDPPSPPCEQWYVECRDICEGAVWGFFWLEEPKRPANVCTVYSFPPCCWNLCQVGRQFLSVVDNSKVWANCLLFHSRIRLRLLRLVNSDMEIRLQWFFNSLMRFTSKSCQIIFLKMFVKNVFQFVNPFLANLHS
jgi:hypothetical protein